MVFIVHLDVLLEAPGQDRWRNLSQGKEYEHPQDLMREVTYDRVFTEPVHPSRLSSALHT